MMIRSVLFGIVLGATLLAQAQPPARRSPPFAQLGCSTASTTQPSPTLSSSSKASRIRRGRLATCRFRPAHRRSTLATRRCCRASSTRTPTSRTKLRRLERRHRSPALRRTVAEAALRAADNARRTLMAGFTTIRNVGAADSSTSALRNAIARRLRHRAAHADRRCTRSAHAAATATTTASVPGFGAEPGIADGIADGPDQFRDAVRFQVKYGADVIKICATGGVLSEGDAVGAPQ